MQGSDIRTIQELPGHSDVKTTMIYTHVLNRGGQGVTSPLDKNWRASVMAEDVTGGAWVTHGDRDASGGTVALTKVTALRRN